MPKFLIEVPHDATPAACDTAIHAFQNAGSHFFTNANWGCHDNVHKAWILAELENKNEAVLILPPAFRKDAVITAVENLTADSMRSVADEHHRE